MKPVTLPQEELFEMLDVADEMVRFCAVSMPPERYYAVAGAVWVIAHRAAGNDEEADRLLADLRNSRDRYKALSDHEQ